MCVARVRVAIAILFALLFGTALDTARADPYHWCAVYGGGSSDDSGTNCYFVTLAQCRAAISGVGGICTPNQFYDGRPVTTPEDRVRRGLKSAR
jgi:hypothetical protein